MLRGVPLVGVRASVRSVWSAHGLAPWSTDDLLALAHRWIARFETLEPGVRARRRRTG